MPLVNLTDMKEVRSWDDAHRIIEEWKASGGPRRFRKWPAGTAPLDARTKRHVALETASETSYRAVFYGTTMATFMVSGFVELRVPRTASDRQFMERVMPKGISFMRVGERTYCKYTIMLNETEEFGEEIFLPRTNNALFVTTPRSILPTSTTAVVRTRAQLAHRRVPPLMKLVQPIIDWRRSVDRLGLPPGGARPTPHLSQKLVEGILHDPTKWDFFLNYSANEILGEVLRALGILTFSREEFTRDIYKGPSEKWLALIPQLHNSHELKLV